MSDIQGEAINFQAFKLKKNPVEYSIRFTHDEQGFYFWVDGVEDTPRDREAIAADLRAAANSLLEGVSYQD